MAELGGPIRTRPFRILLVEDNPGDSNIIRTLVDRGGFPLSLEVLGDGESAIHYLLNRGAYRDAVAPDAVVLDMNLPLRNALEILEAVHEKVKAASIPVFVLSGCLTQADMALCRQLGAIACFTKPHDFDEYEKLVRSLVTDELPKVLKG